MYITREDLEVFGFAAECPGFMSLLKETARQAHTENCRKADPGVVERQSEGGSSRQACDGISDHTADRNATNEIEPR